MPGCHLSAEGGEVLLEILVGWGLTPRVFLFGRVQRNNSMDKRMLRFYDKELAHLRAMDGE